MRKGIIFSFLVIFLLFFSTNIVFAISSFLPQFGGRIIHTKSIEIEGLEAAGFECIVPGSTISIVPIGSPSGTPTSYFIPFGIYSKTGYSLRAGQLIIGKYNWKVEIECVLSYPPYITIPVSLDTITLFGNSR